MASGKELSQTSCDIFSAALRNTVSNVRQINICIHVIVERCLGPYLKGLTKNSDISNKISGDLFHKHRKVTESSLQG